MRRIQQTFIPVILIALNLAVSGFIYGQTSTWNGAGSDNNWSNNDNWDTTAPNGSSADVIIGAPSPTEMNLNVSLNSLAIGGGGILNIQGNRFLGFSSGTATTSLTNAGQINISNGGNLELYNSVFNSGSISMNDTTTILRVAAGGATLDGGGTINMNGSSSLIQGASNPLLTIVNQTIQGQGNFGGNGLGIDNRAGGLIDANSNGNILRIDPNLSLGLTNSGTMQASAGGILQLSGGSGGGFDNTGGTIQALAGSEVQLFVGASITGGNLATFDDGVIRTNGFGYLNDVSLNGNLNGDNGSTTGIAGTINNSGSINLNSTGSVTSLEVQSTATTLDGGGTVNLNSSSSRISGLSGAQLTIGNQTIQGQGNIGGNIVAIDVQSNGLIDANSNGNILTIDPEATNGLTNMGTLQASSGGILRLSGGTGGGFDNNTGTIQALDGSEVQLSSGASVTGGNLSTTGSGVIRTIASGAGILQDVNLNGSFIGDNGSTTGIGGTILNNGSIDLNSTGIATRLEVQAGGATLNGSGTVNLNSGNAGISGLGNALLNVNQAVRGQGNIGLNTIGVNIQSGGLVDANSNGNVLLVDPDVTSGLTNQGTMQASGGGILSLSGGFGGNFDNNGGTIQALAGSEVRFQSGASVTGGMIKSSAGGQLSVVGSATFSDVDFDGNFVAGNGTTTTISGMISNSGSMTFSSTGSATSLKIQGTGGSGARLNGGGTITLDNASISATSSWAGLVLENQTIEGSGQMGQGTTTIVNGVGGTIHSNVQSGQLRIDIVNNEFQDAFFNNGNLLVSNDSQMIILDTLSNEVNGTVSISPYTFGSALVVDNGTFFNRGRLEGTGSILASSKDPNGIFFDNNGVIAPGGLGITGDLVIAPDLFAVNAGAALNSGSLEIEIASASDYDTLTILGSDLTILTQGTDLPTLDVSLLDGFIPDASDVFSVLINTGNGLVGEFDNAPDRGTLWLADGSGTFEAVYSNDRVQLRNFQASAIPEPSSLVILAVTSMALVCRRRR